MEWALSDCSLARLSPFEKVVSWSPFSVQECWNVNGPFISGQWFALYRLLLGFTGWAFWIKGIFLLMCLIKHLADHRMCAWVHYMLHILCNPSSKLYGRSVGSVRLPILGKTMTKLDDHPTSQNILQSIIWGTITLKYFCSASCSLARPRTVMVHG